jgi:hypothetical protein
MKTLALFVNTEDMLWNNDVRRQFKGDVVGVAQQRLRIYPFRPSPLVELILGPRRPY